VRSLAFIDLRVVVNGTSSRTGGRGIAPSLSVLTGAGPCCSRSVGDTHAVQECDALFWENPDNSGGRGSGRVG
jgi:hypothetical protein